MSLQLNNQGPRAEIRGVDTSKVLQIDAIWNESDQQWEKFQFNFSGTQDIADLWQATAKLWTHSTLQRFYGLDPREIESYTRRQNHQAKLADSAYFNDFSQHLKKLKQELLHALAVYWADEEILGPTVCQCLGWKYRSLEMILKKVAPRSLDLLISMSGAGSVCRQCINPDLGPKREWFLERVWDGFHHSESAQSILLPKMDKGQFTTQEEALEVFDEWISRDGGVFEVVDTIENDLVINLSGACQNCPSRERSCRHLLQRWLRKTRSLGPDEGQVWVEKV